MKFSIVQLLWLTLLTACVCYAAVVFKEQVIPYWQEPAELKPLLILSTLLVVGSIAYGGTTNWYVKCGACGGKGKHSLKYADKICGRCEGTGNQNFRRPQ